MTTADMAREVEELRKDCASYTERLERIKSATNRVTPEEKEKVKSWGGWEECTAQSTLRLLIANAWLLYLAWLTPGWKQTALVLGCSHVGTAEPMSELWWGAHSMAASIASAVLSLQISGQLLGTINSISSCFWWAISESSSCSCQGISSAA